MIAFQMKPGSRWLLAGTMLAVLLSGLHSGSPARAATAQASQDFEFGDLAFQDTWRRTDMLVAQGQVKRSYFWGPGPIEESRMEPYAEGPNGLHMVQYFDKSRMEINNPNSSRSNPFYVTNGLLTVELITGQMQVGNSQFVDRWPAEVNLASDADDTGAGTPTYASFRGVVGGNGSGNRTGQPVVESINRAGVTQQDNSHSAAGVKYAYYEAVTKHNIPDVFWQFLNQTGPIYVDGKVSTARLNDPYFYATGYPISEAYWARVKIAGVPNVAVLVQAYERRVLTYVPSAPEGFKVQMGNIGRHYFDWRYKDVGRPATLQCKQAINHPGMNKVWSDNPWVQRSLGCMSGYAGFDTQVVFQQFQNGVMLDVIIRDQGSPRNPGSQTKDIYVLYNDGSAQHFPDTYADGTPLSPVSPPAGLLVPQGGFGKLWRDNSAVAQKIGYATQPEVGERASSSESLFLYFEKGRMIRSGNRVFVLYAENGAPPTDPGAWALFELK